MCSNCSGDYEDPDVTNPPAEDEPEPDTGPTCKVRSRPGQRCFCRR